MTQPCIFSWMWTSTGRQILEAPGDFTVKLFGRKGPHWMKLITPPENQTLIFHVPVLHLINWDTALEAIWSCSEKDPFQKNNLFFS